MGAVRNRLHLLLFAWLLVATGFAGAAAYAQEGSQQPDVSFYEASLSSPNVDWSGSTIRGGYSEEYISKTTRTGTINTGPPPKVEPDITVPVGGGSVGGSASSYIEYYQRNPDGSFTRARLELTATMKAEYHADAGVFKIVDPSTGKEYTAVGGQFAGGIEVTVKAEGQADARVTLLPGVDLKAAIKGSIEAAMTTGGRIGAYLSEKGLYVGAEADVFAGVKARVEGTLTLDTDWGAASVTVFAEGRLGLGLEAGLGVEIGFDGKVRVFGEFSATFLAGGLLGVAVEFDAAKLLQKLGLNDITELMALARELAGDPIGFLKKLLGDYFEALQRDAHLARRYAELRRMLKEHPQLVSLCEHLNAYAKASAQERPVGAYYDIAAFVRGYEKATSGVNGFGSGKLPWELSMPAAQDESLRGKTERPEQESK